MGTELWPTFPDLKQPLQAQHPGIQLGQPLQSSAAFSPSNMRHSLSSYRYRFCAHSLPASYLVWVSSIAKQNPDFFSSLPVSEACLKRLFKNKNRIRLLMGAAPWLVLPGTLLRRLIVTRTMNNSGNFYNCEFIKGKKSLVLKTLSQSHGRWMQQFLHRQSSPLIKIQSKQHTRHSFAIPVIGLQVCNSSRKS